MGRQCAGRGIKPAFLMDDQDSASSSIITRPIILGDLTLASPTTQTTVGSAGAASALPATPTGYLTVNLGNGPVIIPYYAVS